MTSPISLADPASAGLASWLRQQAVSLAFSTYRANRLLFLGVDAQPNPSLKLHERLFDRRNGPMLRLLKRHLGKHLSGIGRSRFSQAPPLQVPSAQASQSQTIQLQAPPATGQRETPAAANDQQEAASPVTSHQETTAATGQQEKPLPTEPLQPP